MHPIVSVVVARADNGVIGRDNALPWHVPADLKYFKRLTVGKPVIMGRKTFESIGRPLPSRQNIVVTRNRDWAFPGVTAVPNLAEAIAAAGLDPKVRASEIMVIGGADIYAQALLFADKVYLTEVHYAPEGDTVFPELASQEWREISREDHPAELRQPAFSFVVLDRVY